MSSIPENRIVVIGGGPAGLMAAETANAAGMSVDIYERMGSVGRKFLIAGKGGLNLTHSEPRDAFVTRFGSRQNEVARWLDQFDPDVLRKWAAELGIDTFVGSSGRVFPKDLKAAPLLRGWVRRLRASGVRFHVHHRWLGWNDAGTLRFSTQSGDVNVAADALILALGGGSWSILGSDGSWQETLRERGIEVAPLKPANCGFDVDWTPFLREQHAGAPIKPVAIQTSAAGQSSRQGEFVLTRDGVEGSLIYALSAELREAIDAQGLTTIRLDLAPDRDLDRLIRDLSRPRGKRSMAKHLHRNAGLEGAKVALLHEVCEREAFHDATRLANAIKALPLRLLRARPIDETISSAGGVRLEALDHQLMVNALPGIFCAGEMLDWEAPTGGYLLSASFASGRIAGAGAASWLRATTTRCDSAAGHAVPHPSDSATGQP
ncbi:MAG TPA: TIGR03862 family flavoprotein [Dokdonella sp.]|uniref:TIGR03862 family flavoprotein n=1 Tax=Dokdonella sp. TaxID=2291710 RepID=UPI002D7FA1F2|nr:TIGR03862 family flavoprotein [Dokdonella sp.]HET9033494.1 TIGR03862 family flavoprotein [Dokdonella sp.]